MIEATRPAAATNDAGRPYLEGIYLDSADGRLCAAATDGYRCIQASADAPGGIDGFKGAIIGNRAVGLLRKLLNKASGEASVRLTAKAIEVTVGDAVLCAKLIDHDYPDYRRTIPSPGDLSLTIARDGLIDPVGAVAAVIDAEGAAKSRAVAIHLGAEEEREVRASDVSGTQAVEPLDCEVVGGPFVFGVNGKFLREVAAVFSEAAKLTVSMVNPAAPMRVTSDRDPDLVAVVMPMKI